MPQSEPSLFNQIQNHRPLCAMCGAPTMLARIEPTDSQDHDQRTFECAACGYTDTVMVKFK